MKHYQSYVQLMLIMHLAMSSPTTPRAGNIGGYVGDLHFRFIKSPPHWEGSEDTTPANRRVKLTILEKNVAKLYNCGRSHPNTEADRFIELPDKI